MEANKSNSSYDVSTDSLLFGEDNITVADMEGFDDASFNYSPSVVDAIKQILPSDDPFDSTDFNAVNYINERFPAEQSLQMLDEAIDEMKQKLEDVDKESQDLVRKMAEDKTSGKDSLLFAKEAIAQLAKRFQDIKVASGESEQRVKTITRDIRQLDIGKRNLTSSITTLNHLQMLAEGVDKLQTLKAARQYGDLAPLLEGVNNVLHHLKKYSHIPQVKQLQDQVVTVRSELEVQILGEFSSISHSLSGPSQQLAEACLVAGVLDCSVRMKIIKNVLENQLAEYRIMFAGSEKDGWLTHVDQRKKWFLRAAVDFDRTLAQMFPPDWKVSARLALAFCQMTNSQLTEAMKLKTLDIDSVVLLKAHKILSDLETLIVQKYGSSFSSKDVNMKELSITSVKNEDERKNAYTSMSSIHKNNVELTIDESSKSPFEGSIISCFMPYLNIYLDSVDKRLSEQIDKFSISLKTYKFERLDEEESNVMPCCGELFTLYKNILVEYLHLSGDGSNLPQLTALFQKHLRQFATRVLRQALPTGTSQPLSNIPKDIKEISAIITQVQSLLIREGDVIKLTEEELIRVCSVLVSAEYCTQMTTKLATKLQQKYESADKTEGKKSSSSVISLSAEEDLFHAVLSQCILLLVSHTEGLCDGPLVSLPKRNWLLEQTGDQSNYVLLISNYLSATVPLIRCNLHTSRKYFTRYCDKLASALCNKFTQQLYKCKPINSVGCQQLLQDCHALKATLLHMPVVKGQGMREPPVSYTRMVTKNMSRAELLLQVVMGEYSSATHLLDKTVQLVPGLSLADFQKVLEMRGVKEKSSLLEAYRLRATDGEGSSSPSPYPSSPQHELSKIAKLEKMLKTRRLI